MSFKLLLQEQNKDVARKLGIATALMFTLPFIVFYISLYFIFHQKENPPAWSGGMAVITANIIVIGYVVVAFSEEDDTNKTDTGKGNAKNDGDALGPRSGVFKTRTD